MPDPQFSRLIVGISGATGSLYGVRLLQALQGSDVETHLIGSRWGARTLIHETPYTLDEVQRMAACHYSPGDQGPRVQRFVPDEGDGGGSVQHADAGGHCARQGEHLIHRAADVILKERRRLVLVVRETPLNDIHLENMLKLSRMGVVILPPVPAFYNRPQSIDEMVDQTVMRILDQFDIHLDLTRRWDGEMLPTSSKASD